jgi:hypothetical protein
VEVAIANDQAGYPLKIAAVPHLDIATAEGRCHTPRTPQSRNHEHMGQARLKGIQQYPRPPKCVARYRHPNLSRTTVLVLRGGANPVTGPFR